MYSRTCLSSDSMLALWYRPWSWASLHSAPCQEILLWHLCQAEGGQALPLLRRLCGLGAEPGVGVAPGWQFSPGSEGGAILTPKEPIRWAAQSTMVTRLFLPLCKEQWWAALLSWSTSCVTLWLFVTARNVLITLDVLSLTLWTLYMKAVHQCYPNMCIVFQSHQHLKASFLCRHTWPVKLILILRVIHVPSALVCHPFSSLSICCPMLSTKFYSFCWFLWHHYTVETVWKCFTEPEVWPPPEQSQGDRGKDYDSSLFCFSVFSPCSGKNSWVFSFKPLDPIPTS